MGISTFYTLKSTEAIDRNVVKQLLEIKKELQGKFNLITNDEYAEFYCVPPNPEEPTEIERFNIYQNGSDYITQIAADEDIQIKPTLPELIVGFVPTYQTQLIQTKIPWITLSKFRTPENKPLWYSWAWFKCIPNKNPDCPWDSEQTYENMIGILNFLDQKGLLHRIKSEQLELDYPIPERFKDWDKLAKCKI